MLAVSHVATTGSGMHPWWAASSSAMRAGQLKLAAARAAESICGAETVRIGFANARDVQHASQRDAFNP